MYNFNECFNKCFFNKEKLTDESLKKTRDFYYNNSLAQIEEIKNDEFVNNTNQVIIDLENESKKYESGDFKIWIGFLQHAYYEQTGKSIALMDF